MENATESRPIGLTFNAASATALLAKMPTATRFRVATRDGVLFVRPTDRVRGPHVFADFPANTTAGSAIKVSITEDQAAKLNLKLESGQKFGLHAERYGWFYLADSEGSIEGAKATVAR